MCFCSVPPLPHHHVLSPTHTPRSSSPAIDKNLHWGRFIIECMTWFVSSLGWRPISLTSTRQILFDISLCQGMCNLSAGRYFVSWESKRKTHKPPHTQTHDRNIKICSVFSPLPGLLRGKHLFITLRGVFCSLGILLLYIHPFLK